MMMRNLNREFESGDLNRGEDENASDDENAGGDENEEFRSGVGGDVAAALYSEYSRSSCVGRDVFVIHNRG